MSRCGTGDKTNVFASEQMLANQWVVLQRHNPTVSILGECEAFKSIQFPHPS